MNQRFLVVGRPTSPSIAREVASLFFAATHMPAIIPEYGSTTEWPSAAYRERFEPPPWAPARFEPPPTCDEDPVPSIPAVSSATARVLFIMLARTLRCFLNPTRRASSAARPFPPPSIASRISRCSSRRACMMVERPDPSIWWRSAHRSSRLKSPDVSNLLTSASVIDWRLR